MNTRARWTIGILVALVIGLAVGLIIIAADNNNNNNDHSTTTQSTDSTTTPTKPLTTTSQTTTSIPTQTNGGTSVPNPGRSTTPGGTGGL